MAVMGMRTYVWAKGQVEDPNVSEYPDHPMIDLAWEIVAELAQEALEQRGRT